LVEEVTMSRHIWSGALVLFAGLAFAAFAVTTAGNAADLRGAIQACDKGA
jgi:hypothetical protein